MKYLKDPRTYFVIACLSMIWGYNQYLRSNDEIKHLENQVTKLEFERDSLNSELFVKHVELGRYEVAYEIFLERNPKAAEQYGTIISEETE